MFLQTLRYTLRSVVSCSCVRQSSISSFNASNDLQSFPITKLGFRKENTMLSSFEERVFQKPQQVQKRYNSTLVTNGCYDYNNKIHKNNNNTENENEQEIQMKYEEAIQTLNTLQSNADTIRRSVNSYVKQNALEDMPKLLERSGLTLQDLDQQSVIHVSGSKGKGSTCAITESILRAYGVKTGFFSSPHLVSVTERIRINGEPIEKAEFTKAFWRVYKRLYQAREDPNDMPPYFKFLTLLCFNVFIEQKVDVIILEVGIGGELDCTNVVRNTKTIGISSLGLEHTQLLGNTLPEIAWQKAGIIKPGSHVYTSVTQPECLEVIRQRAVEKNATLHVVPDFSAYCHNPTYGHVLRSLNNITQLNGSLAIQLAYDWLRQHKNGFKRNVAINDTTLNTAVIDGLQTCNWPGRCQLVKFLNLNVHLDGAHTVESMQICSKWFSTVAINSVIPKVLIFNTTGERDSKKLLSILRKNSNFDVVCFVPNIVTSNRSSRNDVMSAIGFTEQFKRAKLHADNWKLLCSEATEHDNSYVFESILDTFNYLRKFYGSEQQLDVLVTGSIHLIGATILALNEYKKNLDKI